MIDLKTYRVRWSETHLYETYVEAKNESDAVSKASVSDDSQDVRTLSSFDDPTAEEID